MKSSWLEQDSISFTVDIEVQTRRGGKDEGVILRNSLVELGAKSPSSGTCRPRTAIASRGVVAITAMISTPLTLPLGHLLGTPSLAKSAAADAQSIHQ